MQCQFSRSVRTSSAIFAFLLVGLATARADTLELTLDFAEIVRLDRPAATIVIGNPEIADATVGDERTLVLTGRTVGFTNMIILDEEGQEIASTTLRVASRAGNRVTVRYGYRRHTYLCTQGCTEMEAADTELQFSEDRAAAPGQTPQEPVIVGQAAEEPAGGDIVSE